MTEAMFCRKLRRNLAHKMRQQKLSIRRMGERASMPHTTVQGILSEKRKEAPSCYHVLLLAQGLECSVEDLIA